MNEFSINELETLSACVSVYAKDEPNDYLPLFDKLCGLINNYCEHEWVDTYTERGVCRCSKCDEVSL